MLVGALFDPVGEGLELAAEHVFVKGANELPVERAGATARAAAGRKRSVRDVDGGASAHALLEGESVGEGGASSRATVVVNPSACVDQLTLGRHGVPWT